MKGEGERKTKGDEEGGEGEREGRGFFITKPSGIYGCLQALESHKFVLRHEAIYLVCFFLFFVCFFFLCKNCPRSTWLKQQMPVLAFLGDFV